MPATLINFYRGNLEQKIYMLSSYISFNEQGLKSVRDDAKEKLDQQLKPDRADVLSNLGAYADHAYRFHGEFPMIMRYSHITSIYSFLEYELQQLCEEVIKREKGDINVKVSDLKGFPYISSSKIFLTKIIDGGFTEWGVIDDLAKVRNCIIHCNGVVEHSSSRSKIGNIIKHTNGIEINDEGRLLIKNEYVGYILDKVQNLFKVVLDKLRFGVGFANSYAIPEHSAILISEIDGTVKIHSDEDDDL